MKERFRERLPLVRPLFIPLIFYLGLLVLVVTFLDIMPASPWRYLVALTPMLPGFFLAVGAVDAIRKLDELSRKIIFESLAIAFAATLCLLIGLGLVEMAGLSGPGSMYIALFMMLVALAAKLIISRRYE